MLTRRELIGATVGAAVAAKAFALSEDRFRWAINTHMFTRGSRNSSGCLRAAMRSISPSVPVAWTFRR